MHFYFGNINARKSLFSCSFVWNCILAHQMILSPMGTLRLISHLQSAGWVASDLIQMMGGLRLGNAALALQGLITSDIQTKRSMSRSTSFVLAFSGITNLVIGLAIWRKGRFHSGRLVALLLVEASLASGHLLHYLSSEA
jgi:hypothetical protein